MKKSKKGPVIVIIFLTLALLGTGLILAWNSPLFGRSLFGLSSSFNLSSLLSINAPTRGKENASEESPVENIGGLSEQVEVEALPLVAKVEAQNLTGETQPKPACGGPETLSVLVLGIDENEQADAIRLVRIDFVNKKVWVLSIPRDFYVPIADMSMNGINNGRINAAYGYGEYFNGKGGGIVSIANNINYNFGVTFDNYFILHFDEIAKYIDMIDGVDIVLDKPVADGNLYFEAGPHHFDGETAVAFMRMRYYDTDFHRVRRQSQILTAFYKKTMDEFNLVQLLKVSVTVLADKSISTDFGIKDVYPLACLARDLKSSDVSFIEIPKEMYHGATTIYGGAVQIPHDTVPVFIQSVMDGSYQP
jgi:LCP family protein required for cell wall assembly